MPQGLIYQKKASNSYDTDQDRNTCHKALLSLFFT